MSATLYGPMPAPNGVGDPAWHAASEWNGYKPGPWATDWWRTGAPADSTPDLKRRSEIKVGANEASVRVYCGMISKWSGFILPRLGAAAAEFRHWHCVVQLIGPNYDGQYVGGASVALMVEQGVWKIQQGLREWSHDLMPYEEGRAVAVNIEVTASELDTVGEVRVTMTYSGQPSQSWVFNHKTYWHQYLVWSSGLYRGSGNTPFEQGGPQPTYEQVVLLKDLHVTNRWPAVAPV